MPTGAIAIGSFLLPAATTATAFAVGLGVQTAIGLALYAISGSSNLSNQNQGYSVTTTSAAAEHQIIYGETRVGGVRVFDATTGSDSKYLHRVLAFAGHEIEAFKEIYIGEHKVTSFASTADDGFGEGNVLTTDDPEFSDRYDGFVEVYKHYGTADQVADPLLVSRVGDDAAAPAWGANHRLRGIAYLYVRLKYDPDVFPNGVPEITAVVRGKKVFDPRTGTTAWSTDPALCIRDYLSSTGYGLGEINTSLDDTRIAAAADICDEDVTYNVDGNSVTKTRYTCNGAFLTNAQPVDVLQTMLTSCAGLLWYAQGQWRLKAGYYQTPIMTLTDDDARGSYKVTTRNSRRDTFNGVTGTFRGSESDWQTTDYPPVKSAASIAADGGQESLTDLNLPFTDTSLEARRLALIALEQNRQQITLQADFSLRAFKLQVGDVVNLTLPRFGWDTKPFEVISWGFQVDADLTIPVNMTLRETASTIYDTVDDTELYESDNTDLDSPFLTQTPNSLTATLDKNVQADGSTLISIDFAWAVTDPSAVAYYEFEWKLTTVSEYNSVVVNETQWELTGAKNNVTYEFRVRSVSQLGIKSPYANGSIATGIDTSVPKAPTSVLASGNYRMVRVSWTPPTQNTDDTAILDLYQHKIYRGTTSGFTPSDATNIIGTVSGNVFSDTGLDDDTTYYYKVKAVDFTGNVSAASTAGSGTTDAAVSSAIADAIENSTAIQTVNTNTATGDYDGQIVLSSVDGNLYVWDASTGEWVIAVESVDLTGAVDVAAFADGIEPVQIVSVLPSSGTVGEVVYLTSDGKLYTWNGSEWVTGVAAEDITGTIDAAAQVDLSGAVDVAAFADGIEPVQIVSVLPSSGTVGETVYLTSDGKLYTWNGSEWVTGVAAEDITGTIDAAAQVDLSGAVDVAAFAAGLTPVEIVSTLPATGNYAGRMVFLTTDEKLYRHTGSPLDATGWTVAVDGADIVANSITAGKIEAGAIGADQIAANAITTEKLAVGDFSSAVTNYTFANSAEGWTLETGFVVESANTASGTTAVATMPTQQALRADVIVLEREADFPMDFAVVPGKELLLSIDYAGVGSSISRTWRAQVYFEDADGVFLSVTSNSVTVTSTTWAQETFVVTVPANATAVYLVKLRVLAGGSSNQIYATNVKLQQITDGVLIQDGVIDATKIVAGGIDAVDIVATGTITGSLIQGTTITGDKLVANTITAGQIEANTITAGEIAVGAIGADQIAANAITTEKLAVGDFSSAVTNYTFANSAEGWTLETGFVVESANTASGTTAVATMPTQQALRADVTVLEREADFLMDFAVVPGKELLLSIDYAGVGSSISRTWRAQVYFEDADGAFLSLNTNDIAVTSTTWARETFVVTVPANATAVYLVKLRVLAGGSSNQIYATNVKLQQITDGVLIQDGVIDATKIVAGGIDAVDIVATGTITGSLIQANTITADNLVANTITAGEIAVGAVGADQIAANAITTEKLAVGNFNTIVTNYAFTKKTGTSVAEGWSYAGTEFEVVDYNSGSVINAVATMPTSQAIRAILASTQVDCDFAVDYTTFPDEEFVVSFDYAGQGSIAADTRLVSVLMFFDDADGTLISAPSNGVTVSSTTWASTSFKITAPAGAAKLDLVRLRAASDSAENVYIANLKVQQVTTGVLIQDGVIDATKIVAGGIDAVDIVATGTITGSLIQANTITADNLVANTITAGEIAVGAIGADQIAANAITTEKLAVGDFSSAVTNYTFANSAEGWTLETGFVVESANTASGTTAVATMPTQQALRADVTALEREADFLMDFAVVPGKELLLSIDYAGVGSSISRTWRAQVYFEDADGVFLSVTSNSVTVTSTTWAQETFVVTVPANATAVYLVKLRALASGSSNQIYATNVKLQQITDGVLIQDGVIDANKIVTGGIDAQNIIANGTITAVQIDAAGIDAVDIIATGTITAALINVSQLDAVSATIGTLRTATTGERVEIKDNQIVVYDSSGTAVVIIGDLTGF